MSNLSIAVIVKLEPDFSEGNVSYNPDGTLNRSETKNILGVHSAVAANAAFYAKVKYEATVSVATMGPPNADVALRQAQLISDAEELHLYSDRLFAGADTLATAEVLYRGIQRMKNKPDLVFSGHRASDGETGQTGPQTAWKLGYTFLGHVISYDIDTESKIVRATRLIKLQGHPDIIEEVEVPLPAFISIDPSYKSTFNKISERLAYERYRREARSRSENHKSYLKILNVKELEADPTLVGLPGSPTIVYRVERIPKAKASRQADIINGNDSQKLAGVVHRIDEILATKSKV